jgi:hypothetical protein
LFLLDPCIHRECKLITLPGTREACENCETKTEKFKSEPVAIE